MDMADLAAQLARIVGVQHVLSGDAVRPFAHDIYRSKELPWLVVAPGTVHELCEVVREAASAGRPVCVRAGGSSYTDGYLPAQVGTIMLDMRRLDRIVEINRTDAYVTVEAGVTWSKLAVVLEAQGLRTPFQGPFSGLVSSVGGAMSQHAISLGTGAHGTSASSAQAFDIVMADGSLLRTGSAMRGLSPFAREYGPDLTGLFTGDCGAFGVKARVTLPLLANSAASGGASFAFNSFDAMHRAMQAAAWIGVDETNFSFDSAMLRGQMERVRGLPARFVALADVLRGARSPGGRVANILRFGLSGRRAFRHSPYMSHFIVHGDDAREVRGRLCRLRQVARPFGSEIPPAVPFIVRARPFEKMFNVVGPAGERWVPLHGVLPHSGVADFHAAVLSFFTDRADDMQRLGVWSGTMFEAIGRGAMSYEIALYWPDCLSDYHLQEIQPTVLARLGRHPSNPEARAFVDSLKQDLMTLYDKHGATHFQLGKAYCYASLLTRDAFRTVVQIKQALDPDNVMNPGALGL
jgi:glycolate oxidase